jgi:hypothetical protein
MRGALNEKEVELSSGRLIITQFPVLRAIRVGARFAKVAAPILAGLGRGVNMDDFVNGKLQQMVASGDFSLNEALQGVMSALADKLNPDEFLALCEDLLSSAALIVSDPSGPTKIELTSKANIESAFGGSIPDLFLALKAALEVNDFFGFAAIGKFRGLIPAKKQNSPAGSKKA